MRYLTDISSPKFHSIPQSLMDLLLGAINFKKEKKKKNPMAELWVKFHLGPNEDYSPGDSISDNSEKLLQRHRGKVSIHIILVKWGKCHQVCIYIYIYILQEVSVSSSIGKESACTAGDLGSIPGLERSPGRKWQPTPVLLLEESHGQRSLAGYSPWGSKSQTQFSIIFFFSFC